MMLGFFANRVNQTTDRYMWPWGYDQSIPSSQSFIIVPTAGTLKNMFVQARTTGAGSGTITFQVNKNGIATSLVISGVSQNTDLKSSNTTDTVAVVPGDRISVLAKCVGSTPTTDAFQVALSIELEVT